MAENNNENGKFVRAPAQVNVADINALRGLRVDTGATRRNAGLQAEQMQAAQPIAAQSLQAGKEKPQGAISAKQEILMLEEQDRRGMLSLDERARLEDLRKMDDADGLINQKQNDDVKVEDPDSDKFAEMDVIKYMYEKWLLAGLEWCSNKVEKGIDYAWEYSRRRVKNRLDQRDADNNAYKAGTTFKTAEKINKEVDSRTEKRRKDSKSELNDIKVISLKISDGTLFDKDENGNFGKEAKLFARYVGATDEHGNIDESKIPTNQAWQNVQKQFDKYREGKAGAEKGKDFPEAAKLRELGTRFGTFLGRRVTYDCNRDIASLQATGARMMREIASNPKAFDGQEISQAFNKSFERTDAEMRKKTDSERTAYATQPIRGMGMFNEVGLDNMSKKAKSLHFGDRTKLASMGLLRFSADAPELAHLAATADNAIAREFDGIGKKMVKERGKCLIKNNHLNNLNEELSGKSNQNQNTVEAYVVEENAPERSSGKQDMREAANASNRQLNNLNGQKSKVEAQMADNDARMAEHNESPTKKRLEWMHNLMHKKENTAQKTGNQFSNLQIDNGRGGY